MLGVREWDTVKELGNMCGILMQAEKIEEIIVDFST